MSAVTMIVTELNSLVQRDTKHLTDYQHGESHVNLPADYQAWYTLALSFIWKIVPERLADFQRAYKVDKRKEIDFESYTISDYLIGLDGTSSGPTLFTSHKYFIMKFI